MSNVYDMNLSYGIFFISVSSTIAAAIFGGLLLDKIMINIQERIKFSNQVKIIIQLAIGITIVYLIHKLFPKFLTKISVNYFITFFFATQYVLQRDLADST